ncbi:MAG: GNAT family N-acetyltransferase [Bacteroidia bacterium]|nr:GNAT family N-acetyltransferase [Bacteroidia bacterium]
MFKVIKASYNDDNYHHTIQLRNNVLRSPLGLDIADDDLSDEINQIHFVAIENNEVVGVVILVPNYKDKVGKLRQMATSPQVRGKGYGIALVNALETYAAQNGMTTIELNARHYAVGFYEKIGYTICSDVFQEVGINHYTMQKEIITV